MTDKELIAHLDAVMKVYKGDTDILRNAVGAVMFGRIYGWRVLRIMTSSGAYTKYQRILGLDFKEVLPEKTEFSDRSLAYKLIKNLSHFWKVVRGQEPLEEKVKNILADEQIETGIL